MIRISKLVVLLVALVVFGGICRAAETTIKEFKAEIGELKKTSGEMPWLLETKKGSTSALGKLDKPVTGKATFKLKVQTAQKSRIRNGALLLKSSNKRTVNAGIQIGSKQYSVSGEVVKEIRKSDAKMNQSQVFDLTVTVNIPAKTLTMTVNGQEIGKTKLKNSFKDIAEAGFYVYRTATKFSDISIDNE